LTSLNDTRLSVLLEPVGADELIKKKKEKKKRLVQLFKCGDIPFTFIMKIAVLCK